LMCIGAAETPPMTVAATAATTHMRVACIVNPLESLNFNSAPAVSGAPFGI